MSMRHRTLPRGPRWAGLALPLGLCIAATDAHAAPGIEDYKYFRTLSIDLLGRMPTKAEIAAFEKPNFDLNRWLDDHLQGDSYADRLTTIYADLMRPQINGLRYNHTRNVLAWATFRAPSGQLTRLYWRPTQLRPRTTALRATLNADANYKSCAAIKDPARDPLYVTLSCAQYEKYDNLLKTGMCLSADELGIRFYNTNFAPLPYPTLPTDKAGDAPRDAAVQAALDASTVVVRPWWLYADYKNPTPADRYDATTWPARFPGYIPNTTVLKEPDNKTDTVEIRVCKEEVSALRTAAADNVNIKTPVDCLSAYGAAQSSQCGCGAGLENCFPAVTTNSTFPGAAWISSRNVLLGVDDPADTVGFSMFDWHSLWLSQEPLVFLNHLFAEDRDFREAVTGRHTYVNGPLAQFYRSAARAGMGDADLGQTPLPSAAAMPPALSPMDTMTWAKVEDRGPNAAGLLTQPWFSMKNATRRARAHVVYNWFLCRDFVAPAGLRLPPTTEPDLVKRVGCNACHQTLEPLAAYFSRIVENDWSWLDPKFYPTQNVTCKKPSATGNIPGGCTGRYDTVFSTTEAGLLRGAYSAPGNADLGPAGLGQILASKPEYASCLVQNVASSFLGRDLRDEDAVLKQQMIDAVVQSGYRVRPLVKVLLNSNAYRSANNLSSTQWRKGGQP